MPYNVKTVNRDFENVTIRGKVHAVIETDDENSTFPWSSYYTVSFYPRQAPVKYLKFKTLEELQKWGFEKGEWYIVDGHIHQVLSGSYYKDVVFDIKNVSSVVPE